MGKKYVFSLRTIAKGNSGRINLRTVHYLRDFISPHIDTILHGEASTRNNLKMERVHLERMHNPPMRLLEGVNHAL